MFCKKVGSKEGVMVLGVSVVNFMAMSMKPSRRIQQVLIPLPLE